LDQIPDVGRGVDDLPLRPYRNPKRIAVYWNLSDLFVTAGVHYSYAPGSLVGHVGP